MRDYFKSYKIKILIPLLITCIGISTKVSAQTNTTEIVSEQGEFRFRVIEDIKLNENIQPQAIGLNHVAFNDEYLVVSSFSPASVIVYDRDSGNQLRTLGRIGNGPFEYQQITHLQLVGNNVYVNCSTNGLLVFDLDGEHVNQIKYPSQFVTHFHVDEDSRSFAVYNNFSSDKYFVDVFDFDGKKVLDQLGLGTDNDVWLRPFTHAGGVLLDYPELHYILKNENQITSHNLESNRSSTVKFTNRRFISPKFDRSRDQIQADPTLLFSYLMNRSIGSSLYKVGKFFIYEVDHRDESTSNYSEFQILDSNFEYIDSIIITEESRTHFGEYSLSVYQNQISYFWTDESTGESWVRIAEFVE
jgi:hypothetical protein